MHFWIRHVNDVTMSWIVSDNITILQKQNIHKWLLHSAYNCLPELLGINSKKIPQL